MASGQPWSQRPGWQRYGVAVLLTCAIVAGRLALDPWWGHQHNRHLVFIPTAMVAAWFGGFGPGVLSAALSTAALGSFWIGARDPAGAAVVELALFFGVCVAVSAIVESLHRARARAEAAGNSREQVLQIVAHDLRNPLVAIGLSAEALRRIEPSDDAHRHIERIDRAVARMEMMIGDLVDVTGIEHQTLAVSPRREAVEPILRETAEAYTPEAERRQITLEVDRPPPDLALALDRSRIVQLLGNLIGNALKFTPPGGRVEVRVAAQEREVRFEVVDTGPGIPPESVPHIFEPYWKGAGNGTGLGLYIARGIVRAHRGELSVKTAPGAGATFFFTLPRL